MGLLYPGTSVSGYNANPPPDDGTQVPNNQITWAGIKTKVGDPLNTFAGAVDGNITTAFSKTTDGAGVVSTSVDYPAAAADQGRLIVVTVSGKTVTTPDAGAVGAPFVFHVLNRSTGTITLAGNANNAQTVDGLTSQVLQPGSGCAVKTDGTNWFTFGLKSAQINTSGANYGFNAAINLSLSASVGSNLLTIAVKTLAGNDPSAGDPVLIPFRNGADANGTPVWLTLTSALSISTNAVGATLGTQNSVPFRFWIVAFNNGGTPVLALINCSTATQIFPINQNYIANATGISGAATSAGVFYCPNGTTISGKPFRILGWLEYSAGLATAGSYASVPVFLQLFGPGCKLPGDVVQTIYAFDTSSVAGPADTTLSISISPTSAANIIRCDSGVIVQTNGANTSGQMKRSGSFIGINQEGGSVSGGITRSGMDFLIFDKPGTTSSTTYLYNQGGSGTYREGNMIVSELMG